MNLGLITREIQEIQFMPFPCPEIYPSYSTKMPAGGQEDSPFGWPSVDREYHVDSCLHLYRFVVEKIGFVTPRFYGVNRRLPQHLGPAYDVYAFWESGFGNRRTQYHGPRYTRTPCDLWIDRRHPVNESTFGHSGRNGNRI